MKNSLLKKYFAICSMAVLTSITVLGVVLLVCAAQYFERDKYVMLERNARQASAITADNFQQNSGRRIDWELIQIYYAVLGSVVDSEILIVNPSGEVIYVGDRTAHESAVNINLVNKTVADGIYGETGTLGGFFYEKRYTVGVPMISGDMLLGVVFSSVSAAGLNDFMISVSKMFLVSAAIVLSVALIALYFVSQELVKPLQQMSTAAKMFSKGDFSVRLPVSGYDEIGQLAMAINNLAGSLSTNENVRRTFIANVSHELKTPMTTIAGFIDGILDGTIPEGDRDRYLRIVSEEVKRLSRLVRSMLDMARIEAGEIALHPKIFDINDIVCKTIFTFEYRIEQKNLEIQGLDVGKVMVDADQDLIYQVIYNLIDNAVKFVNDGGCISFFYRRDENSMTMTIRNTGEGISKEELPRLFDRFYKSDKSRSGDKSGVGLGLHIVKTIINYHNGEILVRSVQGRYTEFEFTIPQNQQKLAAEK